MVIVFVMDDLYNRKNGTTITALRFADELKRRGHTVRFVAAGYDGDDVFRVKERSVPILTPLCRKQNIILAKPDKKVLKKAFEGADAVHFFMPFLLAKRGRKLAEKMGVPTTAAFHVQPQNISSQIGMYRCKLVNNFIFSFFKARFYKHFKHIHCPTEFIAGELRDHGYQARLHVISNGIDSAFAPSAEPKKVGETFDIHMTGRISNEKRQDLLIEAVKRSKFKDKIRLFFAGQGPNEAWLKRLAKDLPHAPDFRFYTQEELIAKLHDTDLYVHTSQVEIEAIGCLEAVASGLVPVISDSALSATKQFALDERSLFRAGDPADLAQKIDYWIENEDERRRMSAKYAASADSYRLSKMVDKFEEMLNDAIKDAK
jgi:glycosyltransferase involved in cell wall biosynthesis